jgi:hypothetical protein
MAQNRLSWKEASVFTLFGVGPSWMAVNALYQQVPYFELSQPEGYCIAAYITFAISAGAIFPFLVLLYNKLNDGKTLPHSITLPFILGMSLCVLLLISILWHVEISGHSIMLFLCACLAGGQGGLFSVLVMPFLSNYDADCITSARTGSSLGSIACGLLALAQQPGADNSAFTPTVYFLIWASVASISVFSYREIISNGIGLIKTTTKESIHDDINVIEQGTRHHTTTVLTDNPMLTSTTTTTLGEDNTPNNNIEMKILNIATKSNTDTKDCATHTTNGSDIDAAEIRTTNVVLFRKEPLAYLEKKFVELQYSIIVNICPCLDLKAVTWLYTCLPYASALAFVDFHSFGIVPSFFPIALKNASAAYITTSLDTKDIQRSFLSYTYSFSSIFGFLSTFSTYWLKIPLRYALLVYSTMTIFIIIMSSSSFEPSSSMAIKTKILAPLLCIAQVCHASCTTYILAIVWRSISDAKKMSSSIDREKSAAFIGYCDQIFALIGAGTGLLILTVFHSDGKDSKIC